MLVKIIVDLMIVIKVTKTLLGLWINQEVISLTDSHITQGDQETAHL